MKNYINNINIVPYESGNNKYYENIINIIDENRSEVNEIMNMNLFMNSKSIYNVLQKKKEIRPKIEDNCLLNDMILSIILIVFFKIINYI